MIYTYALEGITVPGGRQFVLKCPNNASKHKLHLEDPHEIQASVLKSCRDGSEYYYIGQGLLSLMCRLGISI